MNDLSQLRLVAEKTFEYIALARPSLTTAFIRLYDKATGRIRTVDLRFTKPLLCQLSYGGEIV